MLGIIAVQTGRPSEAAELLERAARIKPGDAEIHNTRGVALCDSGRFAEAVESYDRAIALVPDYAEAHAIFGGVALRNLERRDDALRSYDRAILLKPGFAQAHANRGMALEELRRYAYAVESYRRALQLIPSYPYLYGSWLHAKMQICDWTQIESQFVRFAGKIERWEKAATPWQLPATPCSAALQRRAAEIVVADKYPPSAAAPVFARRTPRDRISIGYFSADFREHAVSHLMAELFERHDRSRFRLIGFSFGPDTGRCYESPSGGGVRAIHRRARQSTSMSRCSREHARSTSPSI